MGFLDKFKKQPEDEPNPWQQSTPKAAPQEDPWRTPKRTATLKAVEASPWVKPDTGLKYRVLHLAAGLMIPLNIGLGIFFYSSNSQFNYVLWAYLAVSTVLLGHYFSLTR